MSTKKTIAAAQSDQAAHTTNLPCECCVPTPDPVGRAADRASFPHEGPWPSARRNLMVSKAAEERLGSLFGPLEGVVHETRSWLIYVEVHLRGAVPEKDYPFVDLHTAGMSQRPMNNPEGRRQGLPLHAELTMRFPDAWCEGESLLKTISRPEKRWPVLWLRALARLPHERNSFLERGHVVTFPEGEYEGCPFNGALMADALWNDDMAVGPYIREDMAAVELLQVVPLLPSETAFAQRNCVDHLVKRLEAADAHETVRLDRAPVI